MNIERKEVTRMTIEDFADQNGLTMKVKERSPRLVRENHLKRWMAEFANSETKGDGVLIGTYGQGDTEREAIQDYAELISEQTLVIDAYKESRLEIQVPVLVEKEP